MNKTLQFALLFFCCVSTNRGFAQKQFTNCAAAFLDQKMVVDEYTPSGKCVLAAHSSGELTVCTADLSPSGSTPIDKIKFRIAIRDANTQTLWMYSDDSYTKVDVQKVLTKCRKGDYIVLLTTDDQYALPHNEILVQ